jgi:hypothetical protein
MNMFCSYCHLEEGQMLQGKYDQHTCMACCRLSENELWMLRLLVNHVSPWSFAGYAQLLHEGLLKERLLAIVNVLKRDDQLCTRYLHRLGS